MRLVIKVLVISKNYSTEEKKKKGKDVIGINKVI